MTLNRHKEMDIISAHAPPVVSNDKATAAEEKQQFYDDLTECVKGIPKNNMLLVMGDMNARVIEATNKKRETSNRKARA